LIVAGFGLEKAGLRAPILGMKNRIGWTTCHSIGGKYAVAKLLEGGIVGKPSGTMSHHRPVSALPVTESLVLPPDQRAKLNEHSTTTLP